ncbi:MAG: DNA alkylation repair protein [Lachnospiraceae bacterium]|nr:DNA alkylation repair protein [Lachnospiraceae bacterium]
MINDEIREELSNLRDEQYALFIEGLTPGVGEGSVIGVRTPALRQYAGKLAIRPDVEEFLHDLPHRYFEENQLHAFITASTKDYGECMDRLERFLPYVDNWATCDQMSPKVFKKNRDRLLVKIRSWISSDHTYTVRFAIKMLMDHFLEEDFSDEYPALVANVTSEEYYINMMRAWYFATALAKQYSSVIPYIEEGRLDKWTHNKTIQKCVESYRIDDQKKDYLRSLRINNKT